MLRMRGSSGRSGPARPVFAGRPGRVRAVPDAAGYRSVAVTPRADHVVISEDRIPGVALTSLRVGGIREALNDADDRTRQRALAAVEEALRSRVQDGELRASRGVLLVTGNA